MDNLARAKSDSAVGFAPSLADAVDLFCALAPDEQLRILTLAAELAAQGQ